MKRALLGLAVATAAGLTTVVPASAASAAAPAPAYCLDGFVWRQAGPSDYVCVRKSARTQAAADNAAAPGRWVDRATRACAKGFVWRAAFDDDKVCVTPEVRRQAQADNAQAENRWVTTRLYLSSYIEPRTPGKPQLSDFDIPKILVRGDHFNYGKSKVYIYRPNGQMVWSGTVEGRTEPGHAGGSFSAKTNVVDCSKIPNSAGSPLAYVQAQDGLSGRWSERQRIQIDCRVTG